MRSEPSQAVVVIHGIGEQRPMDTLRAFVAGVLDDRPDGESTVYSKPDSISDSFELRRLRTRDSRWRTEFFEFYWAHRMPVGTWSRIFEWVRLLLRRRRADVPPQFRGVWWTSWAAVVVAAILMLASIVIGLVPALRPSILPDVRVALPFGAGLLFLGVQSFVLAYIGDAAIYLSPHPRNIEARSAIRSAGLELLKRLHDCGDYDRIIVVGHSLGSVIGYDILCHAWQRFHRIHASPSRPRRDCLKTSERINQSFRSKACSPAGAAQWAQATRKLWQERRALGNTWLVTDFITLGSPLAHADLLLARSRRDFFHKAAQRELPVSPPEADTKGRFSFASKFLPLDSYYLSKKSLRDIFILHHAAWPAVAQWTNLYFPCTYLLHGDVVGGPVSPLFGPGVRDVAVRTKYWRGWLAHCRYWICDARDKGSDDSPIKQLRDALDLRRSTFNA